jgi:hypothetical protein
MRKNINRLTYTMQLKFAQAWKISQKKAFPPTNQTRAKPSCIQKHQQN